MAATIRVSERRAGPAGDATIFADLRLDNKNEVVSSLGLRRDGSVSDHELVLLAWKQWRRGCAERFVGDFAFAIWDSSEQVYFCARDHIGTCPLYYAIAPHGFVCAQTIAGVLDAPGVPHDIDDAYAAAILLDGGFPAPDRTYFSAVRKLPPAHTLVARDRNVSIERYWFPEHVPRIRYRNPDDYSEAAGEIFERAVEDRIRANESVGVHLSGGLDSSSVAVVAARALREARREPPVAFAWQPPPSQDTASSWEHVCISAVAQQERLRVHYCPINPADALTMLRKDAAREPVTSTMLFETTTQRRAAESGCRLILSGFGGDEGLSSRNRGYFGELLLRGRVGSAVRHARHVRSWGWKRIALETALLAFPDRFYLRRRIAARRWRGRLDAPVWINRDFAERAVPLRAPPCREASIHAFLFWQWSSGWLTERMESWHFHGAAHGIRYAYPFLDRRLLEFVAAIPSSQFAEGASPRAFMRRVMRGRLPREFATVDDKPVDDVRTRTAFDEFRAALAAAGRLFAAGKSEREHYVIRARLLEHLDPAILETNVRLGELIRTMSFLDF